MSFVKKKYPHAITKKCCKCGRTFTCKGIGWEKDWKPFKLTGNRCPYELQKCECEQCHSGKSRPEGCEEIKVEHFVFR